MSRSETGSAHGQVVADLLEDFGYDALRQEVEAAFGEDLSGVENGFPEADGTVRDQLQTFGTAVAVSEVMEREGFQVMEQGGWAVFAHLYQEEGIEALNYFRGTDDSDKIVPAADYRPAWVRENDGGLETLLGGNGGVFGRSDRDVIRKSDADHHEGQTKYTMKLEVAPGRDGGRPKEVKLDIVEPDADADSPYRPEAAEQVAFGYVPLFEEDYEDVLSMRVPALEDMLTAKLESYNEKHEERPHDIQDIAALLHVAEQREQREGTGQYTLDALREDIGERTVGCQYEQVETSRGTYEVTHLGEMLDAAVTEIVDDYAHMSAASYTPSREYLGHGGGS